MVEFIILTLIMLPVYGIFIWSYFYPEESLLWGNRWMYKEEPEPTEEVIKFIKIKSIIAVAFMTIILVLSAFKFLNA